MLSARGLRAEVGGQVLLDGRLIHKMPTKEVARTLGLLPQSPQAPEGLTVADLVARGRHPHQAWYRQWSAGDERAVAEALALTGRDVGTPILHFEPPNGVAFFGPVISRLPDEQQAGELWDHVVGLARFPGFAELKRSLRELPQLRALGVEESEVGVQEDWHGGSRRQKR